MAYYQFACEECGKRFIIKQTFTEHDRDPRPKCPKCASRTVRQVISAVYVKTAKKS